MKKILIVTFAWLLIITNTTMVKADKMGFQEDGTLIVPETSAGKLADDIIKYGVSDDFGRIKKLVVKKGSINQRDLEVIKELKLIEELDLSQVDYKDKEFSVDLKDHKTSEFYNKWLEVVKLPKNEKGYTLASEIFMDHKRLKKVELNGARFIEDGAFKNAPVESVILAKDSVLGNHVFEGTSKLQEVDLSEVESFGTALFLDSGLKSVVMPTAEYDLTESFFENTSRLETVDISKAVTIGDRAFYNSNVTEITLASTVGVGQESFANTKNLKELDLLGANSKLSANLFNGSGVESITLPKDVELDAGLFKNTPNLKSLDLSQSVKFGDELFLLSGLESVKLPQEFMLSDAMFAYTDRLNDIDLSTLNHITPYAFFNSNVKRIILPDTIEKSVPSGAFALTNQLKSIHFKDVKALDSNVFSKEYEMIDLNEEDLKIAEKRFDRALSKVDAGLETIVFSGLTPPKIAKDSFAKMNGNPPIVMIPNQHEWQNFAEAISSDDNEIENIATFDSVLYEDQLVSVNQNVQVGFNNLQVKNYADRPIKTMFKWTFNGEEIENANQSTYIIEDFNEEKAGEYRLQIIINDVAYDLESIKLKENALEIKEGSIQKGYFVNEEVDKSKLDLHYISNGKKISIDNEDVDLEYNFDKAGQSLIRIIYHHNDNDVIADYPVVVANSLPETIKLRKGKSFVYDPGIESFEFVMTPELKEKLQLNKSEDHHELTLTAKEKYQGSIDYRLNDRSGHVELKIKSNFTHILKNILLTIFAFLIVTVIYLRKRYGMFKVKKQVKNHD